jgi:hypothetical protein
MTGTTSEHADRREGLRTLTPRNERDHPFTMHHETGDPADLHSFNANLLRTRAKRHDQGAIEALDALDDRGAEVHGRGVGS